MVPSWSLSGSEPTGAFPRGCKWRDVQTPGSNQSFWAIQKYEYWHPHEAAWTAHPPAACEVKGLANPAGYVQHRSCPSSQILHVDCWSCLACQLQLHLMQARHTQSMVSNQDSRCTGHARKSFLIECCTTIEHRLWSIGKTSWG